jgi:hypothetical protein
MLRRLLGMNKGVNGCGMRQAEDCIGGLFFFY